MRRDRHNVVRFECDVGTLAMDRLFRPIAECAYTDASFCSVHQELNCLRTLIDDQFKVLPRTIDSRTVAGELRVEIRPTVYCGAVW